jgi:hypothetical protein
MTEPHEKIERARQAILLAARQADGAAGAIAAHRVDADLPPEDLRTIRESADQIRAAVSAIRSVERLKL